MRFTKAFDLALDHCGVANGVLGALVRGGLRDQSGTAGDHIEWRTDRMGERACHPAHRGAPFGLTQQLGDLEWLGGGRRRTRSCCVVRKHRLDPRWSWAERLTERLPCGAASGSNRRASIGCAPQSDHSQTGCRLLPPPVAKLAWHSQSEWQGGAAGFCETSTIISGVGSPWHCRRHEECTRARLDRHAGAGSLGTSWKSTVWRQVTQ